MNPQRALLVCLETLRELDPEMPLQRASVFLLIAEADPHGGIGFREIEKALCMSRSASSRAYHALADKNRARGRKVLPGPMLVTPIPDPEDVRKSKLILTERGRKLVDKLSMILGDKGRGRETHEMEGRRSYG